MSCASSHSFSIFNQNHNFSLTLTNLSECINITIKHNHKNVNNPVVATSRYCTTRADIVGKQMTYCVLSVNILQIRSVATFYNLADTFINSVPNSLVKNLIRDRVGKGFKQIERRARRKVM